MLHRPRAALLAALLSLLATASALAQGFPATMGPNTVYGRLGVSQGPGQAITFAQLRTALGFVAGTGTVTSVGCGAGLSGGTITGAGSCAVIFGTAANTTAQGNDPRITGAAQTANNLSDLASAVTARSNLGLGTLATQSAAALNVSGVTALTGLPACAGSTDACPKSYIDLLALGFRTLPEVRLATAAVLPNTPTYANGTAGVGATLTAGANAALTVDGTAVVSGNSILVKDQVSTTGCTVANAGCQNGIYTVTTVGDGSNAWVLTRRTDFDTAAEMLGGSISLATAGATNSGKTYDLQSTVTTVGTTPAVFNLLFINGGQWSISGSDVYRSTGNVGLNAAPPAWSGFNVYQAGNGAFASILNTASVFGNKYWDGSHYKYLATDFSGQFVVNTAGGFSWLTSASGTAGDNVASDTQKMTLSNAGTLRLVSYGAGVATFDSSGNFVSKPRGNTSIVYAADYGVIADGSTNNNATLQAAGDACATFPAVGKGCILQLPCGIINVTTGLSWSFAMTIQGCGPGRIDYQEGGTLIQQTCTTCTTFSFVTPAAVTIRDLGFYNGATASAGSWIYIKPVASPTSLPTQGVLINNVRMIGGFGGIFCEFCGNYTFGPNVFINEQKGHGIKVIASTTIPDGGDGTIIGSTIGGVSPTAGGDCIHAQTQSGLKIVGNKLIGCEIAVNLVVDQGVASGTLLIQGNSIEETRINHVRIAQGTAGDLYGFVHIQNNQMQNNNTAAFQGSIAFIAGAAQYIHTCLIQGNNLNNGANSGAMAGILINDCNRVEVSHNIVNNNGNLNTVGIEVGGNATEVYLKDNLNIGSVLPYEINVLTQIRDTNPMDYANRPNVLHVRDGSQIFFTSVTGIGGACSAGGSNAMGFLSASTWRCY